MQVQEKQIECHGKGGGLMKRRFKRGIAMIELIFAIVIMGIALLSAPMLIQQSIASSNVALQQEAIAAIASHMGIILSKHWDEGDTNLSSGVAPIITLTNEVAGSPFNLAGIDMNATNVSGRTSSVSGHTINASAVLGQDSGDFDDVDDYNGLPVNIITFNAESSTVGGLGDYVDGNITINTRVSYADDRPLGGVFGGVGVTTIDIANNIFNNNNIAPNQSNIKYIEATLTSNSGIAELNKTITLRAFSCNLGTYTLKGVQY